MILGDGDKVIGDALIGADLLCQIDKLLLLFVQFVITIGEQLVDGRVDHFIEFEFLAKLVFSEGKLTRECFLI